MTTHQSVRNRSASMKSDRSISPNNNVPVELQDTFGPSSSASSSRDSNFNYTAVDSAPDVDRPLCHDKGSNGRVQLGDIEMGIEGYSHTPRCGRVGDGGCGLEAIPSSSSVDKDLVATTSNTGTVGAAAISTMQHSGPAIYNPLFSKAVEDQT